MDDDQRDEPEPVPDTGDREAVDEPAGIRSPAALTGRERRLVVLVACAPIVVAALVLLPIAWRVGAGVGDVLVAAAVYGGLVGAAAGFVTVDRFHARQCPRCRVRGTRGGEVCTGCGYDLVQRPRFACSEGHRIHLEDGVCACGRRLHPLPTARGVGPQVRFVVKVGLWLLAFLTGVGLLLQILDRSV